MKKLVRDPMRYEPLSLLALYGLQEGLNLRDPLIREGLLKEIDSSLTEAIRDRGLLYGQRTQAMFESLVASLGQFQIFKKEDAGDIYVSDDELEIPDFQVRLANGRRLLIEVKNFNQKSDPNREFSIQRSYLDGLMKYALMLECDLRIAIYWVRWNLWTLSSPAVLQRSGDKLKLSMTQAMFSNEMSILGDKWIGTRFPLIARFYTDRSKPRTIDASGQAEFTIGDVKLFCADREITQQAEQNIAWYLMMFGGWDEDSPAAVSGNELDYFEIQHVPQGENNQDDWAIVGALSSMFSTSYNYSTLEGGAVQHLLRNYAPGFLSQLIEGKHQRDALPLWILDQSPSSNQ